MGGMKNREVGKREIDRRVGSLDRAGEGPVVLALREKFPVFSLPHLPASRCRNWIVTEPIQPARDGCSQPTNSQVL